jgi:hypothetical protein
MSIDDIKQRMWQFSDVMLVSQYRDEIDDLWIETFGHGLDCLIEREAIALCRQQSLVALKTILAQAATEVRARGI